MLYIYFWASSIGNGELRRSFVLAWRFILSTLKQLIILGIIFIALFLYFTGKGKSRGQDWCDEMIADYENDKSRFLDKYQQNTKNGMEYFPPRSKSKDVRAYLTLQANGDYSCRYWHGGVSKPHAYSYDSKTKKWSKID